MNRGKKKSSISTHPSPRQYKQPEIPRVEQMIEIGGRNL